MMASPGAAPTMSWSHISVELRQDPSVAVRLGPARFEREAALHLGDPVLQTAEAVEVDPRVVKPDMWFCRRVSSTSKAVADQANGATWRR